MFAFVVTLLLAASVALGPTGAAAQSTKAPSSTVKASGAAKSTEPARTESTSSQGTGQAEVVGAVVVTATKTALPLSRSPFSTEVISGQELEDKQVPSVKEALRTARGLKVVQTGRGGGTTSIFVRGGESDHNLVILDGIPLNEAGGRFDFSHLTPENVERIEVLRGAGSALYGSDAMTSVIQLITKEGDGPPTLSLSTAFGDQGSTREMASLSGSRPGLRYSLALSRYDTDGFFEPNDFYGNTTATGKVSFGLTDYSQAVFTAYYLERRQGSPNQTGLFVFDRSETTEEDRLVFGLTLKQDLFSWLDHALLIAVTDRELFNNDPIADPPSTVRRPEASVLQSTAFDFTFQRTDELQRRLADYHFNVNVLEDNIITGGVEWETEDGQVGGSSGVTFNDERRNLGYYVQAQLNWRDRIIVVPGVRFEDNQVFGGETVPRAAAALILGDPPEETWVGPLKLKGSWGVGIKEPTFAESFDPPPFEGNPSLAPERAKHWDAGAELTLCKGRCVVEVVYFHVVQKDRIDYVVEDPMTFAGRFQNIGRARSEGVEIYGAVEPWDWLKVEGQYTWLEGVVKEAVDPEDDVFGVGKELLRRPKHSGSGSVVGRFGPLTIRGDLIVVGDRFDSDFRGLQIFENPGYARLDLAARLRLENHIVKLWGSPFPHSVEAFGRVENLLDEDYEEVLGYPSPGINFLAGVQVTFQGAAQAMSAKPQKNVIAKK